MTAHWMVMLPEVFRPRSVSKKVVNVCIPAPVNQVNIVGCQDYALRQCSESHNQV